MEDTDNKGLFYVGTNRTSTCDMGEFRGVGKLAWLRPPAVLEAVQQATIHINEAGEADVQEDMVVIKLEVGSTPTLDKALVEVRRFLKHVAELSDGDSSREADELMKMLDGLQALLDSGDVAAVSLAMMKRGYRICRIEVWPMNEATKTGKKTRKGAAKGRATSSTKAVQLREATQQAVRKRWAESPGAKLSLTTIRDELAILGTKDNRPFGSLKKIEENTKGMQRPK